MSCKRSGEVSMSRYIRTSDVHKANKMWRKLGGQIGSVRRTGEIRYSHPYFKSTIRANGRRKDATVILLSRINLLLRRAPERAKPNVGRDSDSLN